MQNSSSKKRDSMTQAMLDYIRSDEFNTINNLQAEEYISAWVLLDPVERAEHILRHSELYEYVCRCERLKQFLAELDDEE